MSLQKRAGVVFPISPTGPTHSIPHGSMKKIEVTAESPSTGIVEFCIKFIVKDCNVHRETFNFEDEPGKAYVPFHPTSIGHTLDLTDHKLTFDQIKEGSKTKLTFNFNAVLDDGKIGGAGS